MHPIFQRLIDVKWKYFGRKGAWIDIILNLFLTVLYTVLAVTLPDDVEDYYKPLRKNWWRIVVEIVLISLFINEVRKEIKEYYRSKRQISKWTLWRTKEIHRDFEFCHPRSPQEKSFLDKEMEMAKARTSTYFKDLWNYIDWVAYAMLVVVFILHFVNISCGSGNQNKIEIMSCTLIVIWIRLLKYARPFPSQGPFVVILDHIMKDTSKWSFILLMFYIPYGAAFWMMFGGRSQTTEPVRGYENLPILMFTMIRFPLVDDYNFDELRKRYPIMAQVLCGSFLFLGAVILMNMFIALMSNTFQRVYDNAKATAAMQRARLIQDVESDASKKEIAKYKEFIRSQCSPEERDYLVIITDEEDQKRKQKEKISELHNIVSHRLGGKKFGKLEECEFEVALHDIDFLKESNVEVNQALALLAGRLEEVVTSIRGDIECLKASQTQTLAELKLSQERKFEELKQSLAISDQENKTLQAQNTEDLKVFETRNFEELNLLQTQSAEQIRISQEENFEDIKLLQAMNMEEVELLQRQSAEDFKRVNAKESQVRRISRKQIPKEFDQSETQEFEEIKLHIAQRFGELKCTRAQRFQELKTSATRRFEELRSASMQKYQESGLSQGVWQSQAENAKKLDSQVEESEKASEYQIKGHESLKSLSSSVKEYRCIQDREIEKLQSSLAQDIEELKRFQAENIAEIKRVQVKRIHELKGLQSSGIGELERSSTTVGAVGEEDEPAHVRSANKYISALKGIYGGSLALVKTHDPATNRAQSGESTKQDEC